jgi:hypothetical protein
MPIRIKSGDLVLNRVASQANPAFHAWDIATIRQAERSLHRVIDRVGVSGVDAVERLTDERARDASLKIGRHI